MKKKMILKTSRLQYPIERVMIIFWRVKKYIHCYLFISHRHGPSDVVFVRRLFKYNNNNNKLLYFVPLRHDSYGGFENSTYTRARTTKNNANDTYCIGTTQRKKCQTLYKLWRLYWFFFSTISLNNYITRRRKIYTMKT